MTDLKTKTDGATTAADTAPHGATLSVPKLKINGEDFGVTNPEHQSLTPEAMAFFHQDGVPASGTDEKDDQKDGGLDDEHDARGAISGIDGSTNNSKDKREISNRAPARHEQATLRGRAAGRELNLQVSGERSPGNKIARWVAGGGLAVGGAYGGLIAGALVGGALGSAIPVVGTVAGAAVGAAIGTALGWYAGRRAVDYCFKQPQKEHVDHAVASLRGSRGPFTEGENRNLEAVTNKQWRNLLHVPSSKGRYNPQTPWGPRRVKDPERRQQIREALVRHIAVTGDLRSAKLVKATLIEAARQDVDGQRRPRRDDRTTEQRAALNLAVPKLDMAIAQDRLDTIRDGLGLIPPDLPDHVEQTLLTQLSNRRMEMPEEQISEHLVERAASKAAALKPTTARNRLAHDRAVYAVVAHQARYADSADAFMMPGSSPADESLSKILGHYDQGFVANTINKAKQQVAQGKNAWLGTSRVERLGARTERAIASLDATMEAIVGSGRQNGKNLSPVPEGLQWLLHEMAKAAEQHAPVDKQEFKRLAVFHGLLGRNLQGDLDQNLPRAQGVWQQDVDGNYTLRTRNMKQNEALVRDTFRLSAHPVQDLTIAVPSNGDRLDQTERNQAEARVRQAQNRWMPAVDRFVTNLLSGAQPLEHDPSAHAGISGRGLNGIDSSDEEA